MKKETVAIIGMGMMGGSLGLAIKKKSPQTQVLAIGRNLSRLKKAVRLKACDLISDKLIERVSEADIVVICTPVDTIAATVKEILPHLKKGAVITDIGSVKGSIMSAVGSFFKDKLPVSFIGGHPLCGSEKTGIENLREDLYKDTTVVLTPLESNNKKAIEKLKNFWQKVGSNVLVMKPEVHDILVAQTSHLPHVLASSLVQLIYRLHKQDPCIKDILAGSFKDMTRIADADSTQWAQILQANEKFVLGSLKSYRDILTRLIQKIENGKESLSVWNSFFETARSSRRELLLKKQPNSR